MMRKRKVSSIDDISSQFTGITSTIGGEVVGLSSFKLKSLGNSLFYNEFVGSSTSFVSCKSSFAVLPPETSV